MGDVELKGLALIAFDRLALTKLNPTAADIKCEPRFANENVWAYACSYRFELCLVSQAQPLWSRS